MNPPFSRQQDLLHVTHALRFLKSGGTLVSIMSASVEWRDNQRTLEFKEWLGKTARDIKFVKNPEEAFKSSGTCVNTTTLYCVKR